MAGPGGGIASAFGFRYQYLITVEILLELFENSGTRDWTVEVDRADQDSADILVYRSATVSPSRAIQVKASLAESSTTIGLTRVREILAALVREHPAAATHELVTNRTMTAELKQELAVESSTVLTPGKLFRLRAEHRDGLWPHRGAGKFLYPGGGCVGAGCGVMVGMWGSRLTPRVSSAVEPVVEHGGGELPTEPWIVAFEHEYQIS